jgi:hypothetical protein
MIKNERPICLMHKCPNYPCKIMDEVQDKSVLCNKPEFWEKWGKNEK